MTGAANRRRGADAERSVVTYLRTHGWPDARRYLAGDGRQPGDIDAIPGIVIEVKDVAASAWPTWCRQAEAQAGLHRAWIVVRRTRGTRDVGQWGAAWHDPNDVHLAATHGTFAQALAELTDPSEAA